MLGKGLLKCHALSGAGGPTTIKFSTLYHSWFSLISYTSLLCWVLDRKTLQHTTCLYDGIMGTSWDAEGQDQFQAEQDWICVEEIF